MQVRGVELAVASGAAAAGLPLFWGHGLLCSMAQEDSAGILPWAALGAETRLIRWDARGHGNSGAPPRDEDYRWEELARDLWALADALPVERAVLGGVSMGAATALHAAVLAPERTQGLVLMAPPTAWATRPRQAILYRRMASLVDRVGLAPFRWLGWLGSLVVPNPGLRVFQRTVAEGFRHARPPAVSTALRGAALSDLPDPERIAELTAPVLILAWTGDASHPVSTATELAERLPKAELHVASRSDPMESWGKRLSDFVARLRVEEASSL